MPDPILHYVGTLAPSLIDTLEINGVPLSITDKTVLFRMQSDETGLLVVDAPATPTGAAGGVRYDWAPDDVATPGDFTAWWTVIYQNGKTQDSPDFPVRMAEHGVVTDAAPSDGGVCTLWASASDVEQQVGQAVSGVDLSGYLLEASELLYALSARRYPGVCQRTVRPCRRGCACGWQTLSRGHIVLQDWAWDRGRWWGEGSSCGCGILHRVRLAGPVIAVSEVRIGGAVVDPATYRLDRGYELVRLTDPATRANPGWPACQDLGLPDGAPGTFSVDYSWGRMPSRAGVRAAAALAWQLYLSDNRSGECQLPAGWTQVARQGITITRQQASVLGESGSGVGAIDAFLAAANPARLQREPVVYSPDLDEYAR